MGSSNVDWGQDLLYLKAWLEGHPEAHPLGLAFDGGYDPGSVGLDGTDPPETPLPGWYVLTLTGSMGFGTPGATFCDLSRGRESAIRCLPTTSPWMTRIVCVRLGLVELRRRGEAAMKLIVQIPCFNEESTLAKTVADIPRRIEGIDDVRILVIDDGSTDRTCQVAREAGVGPPHRHKRNRGLGCAFRTGIDACLRLGADVIVNTDGDNQYAGGDIPRLSPRSSPAPPTWSSGIGRRGEDTNFSWGKKFPRGGGSSAVRSLSGQPLPDAVSGFRAFAERGGSE